MSAGDVKAAQGPLGSERDSASYRDPSGHVFVGNGRVFRTVSNTAASNYEFIREHGDLAGLVEAGKLIGWKEITPDAIGFSDPNLAYLVEHPRIPLISYPYEWPFAALKAAALFHLELQIDLLDKHIVLADATAYNVQFLGPKPIFIDLLSLKPYRDGEYWIGHRQFSETFLNPLLLMKECGVSYNAWYRGSLEGITTEELARLLPVVRRVYRLASADPASARSTAAVRETGTGR
jgi:ribosomal protein L11 methylase PrmA